MRAELSRPQRSAVRVVKEEVIKTYYYKIEDMDCPQEIRLIEQALKPIVSGENALSFDLLNRKLTVSADDTIDESAIADAIAGTGLRATPWRNDRQSPEQSSIDPKTVACVTSGAFLLCAIILHTAEVGLFSVFAGKDSGSVPVSVIVLYVLSAICGAWFVVPKAINAIRHGRPDIHFLMIVAVIGATVLNEWLEAASVAFLFASAQMLEQWSVGRARKSIESLLSLSPEVARCRHTEDGSVVEVPVNEVVEGVMVLVRPGERIPLDGSIIKGETEIDQSPITGESIPVHKALHDPVYAGTINKSGAIEFVVTKTSENTTLARTIQLVESTQSRRAKTEKWVEKFAKIYTPSVVVAALLIFIAMPLFTGRSWIESGYQALVVLVISCPCALVISTPVSIVAGLARAARQGVLIKGGVFLELPARLRAIAIDKTGTLTTGKPTVAEVFVRDGITTSEVLQIAAALESHSEHPLGKAIIKYARGSKLKFSPSDAYEEIPGLGGQGMINGTAHWVGSSRYLAERSTGDGWGESLSAQQEDLGRTVVAVGRDREILGIIAIADSPRKEAPEVLRQLKHLGIEKIVMLTGDNEGTAVAVAKACGVDSFHACMLPEEKVRIVEALSQSEGCVAMIGDGVNDAPAMAASQLGIAMGAIGTDTAIETADIALMADNLHNLPWVIRHSRRTLAIIRQNIWLAVLTKAIVLALALVGKSTLWMAIAADVGTSLLVIANSLRLLKAKYTSMS